VKLEIARRENGGYASEWEISVDGKNLSIFSVEFLLKRFEKRVNVNSFRCAIVFAGWFHG